MYEIFLINYFVVNDPPKFFILIRADKVTNEYVFLVRKK